MTFRHTNRPGFLLGLIDFCTAGLFFLIYMPLGGLQDEIETILGHPVMPYWKAYVLGIPTAFVYTLVWMARIAEELKEKAEEAAKEGYIRPEDISRLIRFRNDPADESWRI